MKNKALLIAKRISFSILVVSFSCAFGWGQNSHSGSSTIYKGRISDALFASMTPDNRTVGVYLFVGEQNEVSPQEWASTVEKYFKAYGFPVKIFLYYKPVEGKGVTVNIFVGAKEFKGNLSSGSFGLYHLLNDHEKVFAELLEVYKTANPDLFAKKH